METFARATGHQEIGGAAPSRPANFPEPPPIPETEHQLSHRASRASLPLNRQRSHHSARSSRTNRAHDNVTVTASEPGASSIRRSNESGLSDGSEDDFQWGPDHPWNRRQEEFTRRVTCLTSNLIHSPTSFRSSVISCGVAL